MRSSRDDRGEEAFVDWGGVAIIVLAILVWLGRKAPEPPRPGDDGANMAPERPRTPPASPPRAARPSPPPRSARPTPPRPPDASWQAYDEGFWDGAVMGWYGARHWFGAAGDEPAKDPDHDGWNDAGDDDAWDELDDFDDLGD